MSEPSLQDPPADVWHEVYDALHAALGTNDDYDAERDFCNDTTNAVFAAIERCKHAVVHADVPHGSRAVILTEWLTVPGRCNHSSDDFCTRTDHVRRQHSFRWAAPSVDGEQR